MGAEPETPARFRSHRFATYSYVVALALIASLAIGTHVLIDTIVQEQQTTAKVVNVAGRQRMLSQRIASLALEVSMLPPGPARARALDDLGESVALMERSYRALRRGDAVFGMSSGDSERLRQVYDRPPTLLANRLDAFLGRSRDYLANARLGIADPASLASVRSDARHGLVDALDTAVTAYQDDSEEAIRRLRHILFATLGGLLVTLVAEALLIFRPLFRRLEERERVLVDLAADLDQALTMSTAELRLAGNVIQRTAEGIVVVGPDGAILSVNPAFCDLTGLSRAEVIGQPVANLRSGLNGRGFYEEVWATVRAEGSWSGEMWMRRRDGSNFLAHVTINPLARDLADTGATHVAIFADITALRERDETIQHMAFHDALTGLPNRDLAWERMASMASQSASDHETRAVVSLDFDRFKGVNDDFGLDVGDGVLRLAAARLLALLPGTDAVARIAADEFAVLLEPRPDVAQLTALVRRIVAEAGRPYVVSGQQIHLGVSAGAALCPDDGDDAAELLRQAGSARLVAKRQGGGLQFYRPDIDQALRQRLRIEAALREAVAATAFRIEFQPKLDLADGAIDGVEALIRWTHPDLGPISPAVFVPIAEDIGAIGAIGDWVLRESCIAALSLRRHGFAVPVAANVSARQLLAGDLPERVAALLAETGAPPSLLHIELTESSVIADPDSTVAQLARLRDLGVRVALDDFGTGYSSLAYLRRLPIDFVKIDRSFVSHLETESADVTVARGIVALGHALGLKIIAEGIETEGQAAVLRGLGCDVGQGYLYARPLPEIDLLGWLATRRVPALARNFD